MSRLITGQPSQRLTPSGSPLRRTASGLMPCIDRRTRVRVEAPPGAATIGTARPSMTLYLTGMLGAGLRGVIVPDTALSGAVLTPHGKALLVLQSRASLL